MKVITFAHQKGGVGKSTLTINIAFYLQHLNYDVAVLDMDVQGTTWCCLKNIPVYRKTDEIKKEHDFLIIDTPPYKAEGLQELFQNSDIVVVPTRAGIADLIAISGTVEILKAAIKKNNKIKGMVAFNQIDMRNSLLDEIKPEFEKLGLPVLQNKVHSRAAFVRSITEDEGIFSLDDKAAQNDITNIAKEILQ